MSFRSVLKLLGRVNSKETNRSSVMDQKYHFGRPWFQCLPCARQCGQSAEEVWAFRSASTGVVTYRAIERRLPRASGSGWWWTLEAWAGANRARSPVARSAWWASFGSGAAEGGDRPEAACPPGSRPAGGEAGGFNAVQKLLTNRTSDHSVMSRVMLDSRVSVDA